MNHADACLDNRRPNFLKTAIRVQQERDRGSLRRVPGHRRIVALALQSIGRLLLVVSNRLSPPVDAVASDELVLPSFTPTWHKGDSTQTYSDSPASTTLLGVWQDSARLVCRGPLNTWFKPETLLKENTEAILEPMAPLFWMPLVNATCLNWIPMQSVPGRDIPLGEIYIATSNCKDFSLVAHTRRVVDRADVWAYANTGDVYEHGEDAFITKCPRR